MTWPMFNVLIPVYDQFNTLDVNGPLEVLCNAVFGKVGPFKITIAGDHETKAFESITVKPDCTYQEAMERIRNGDFDILLIPGSGVEATKSFWDQDAARAYFEHGKEEPLMTLIREFQKYDNRGTQKWLVSICTGALLVAAAGYFKDRDCTTHWHHLADLQEIGKWWNVSPKSVVRRRYIDGGFLVENGEGSVGKKKKNTRILSSGGISCGIDACLWLVEQTLGVDQAVQVAELMDYKYVAQAVTSRHTTVIPHRH